MRQHTAHILANWPGGEPRSARVTPSRKRPNGADLRQLCRDRAAQDLLHRTEYLAGLTTKVSTLEPPHHQLAKSLAESNAPSILDTLNTALQESDYGRHGKFTMPGAFMGPSIRVRSETTAVKLDEEESRDLRDSRVLGSSHPRSAASKGSDVLTLQGITLWQDVCESTNKMLVSLPSPSLSKPPAIPVSSAFETKLRPQADKARVGNVHAAVTPFKHGMFLDHRQAAEAEWAQHASEGCHTEWLGKEGCIDVTTPGLAFSQHFWRIGGVGTVQGSHRSGPSKFVRLDGSGSAGSGSAGGLAKRFTIMENDSTVIRQEGNDPFHSHAILSCLDPVLVYPQGHYFEVLIRSTFARKGPPERPRYTAARSEGLIIGVTTRHPNDTDSSASRSLHAARGQIWAISSSGHFFGAPLPASTTATATATAPAAAGAGRAATATTTTTTRDSSSPAAPPPEGGRVGDEVEGAKDSTTVAAPAPAAAAAASPPAAAAAAAAAASSSSPTCSAGASAPAAAAAAVVALHRPLIGHSSEERPRRPVPQVHQAWRESTTKPRWHQQQPSSQRQDPLKCSWPPPGMDGETEAGALRRANLSCSLTLKEKDVVGLLVTPFGGLVLFVNGVRRIFVPDANAPSGTNLYPVLEVFNHIRSLQLARRAGVPP